MTTHPPSRDIAIHYALENKWKEAHGENLRLLEIDPQDIDTLNRLAYALVRLSKFRKAKEYYQQVIKKDKTNPIALKNLKRLDTISRSGKNLLQNQSDGMRLQDVFIEEAGKTKTIDLKNVADKKTLSLLQPGNTVVLVVKRSKVFVQMTNKTYLGMLPDNVGMRMIPLTNGGNEYSACIKAFGDKFVTVFIKETKKMAKFKNQPSFMNVPVNILSEK